MHLDGFVCHLSESESIRCSVMLDSLIPCGLYLAQQAPLSMGFPRQEYWSGLPFHLNRFY